MLEPNFQPIHNGSRVRPIGQSNVISFEGFNKALSHAITLRALHWRRNRLQTQGSSKGSCITRDLARSIIRKPLHLVGRSLTGTKPIFNSLHHQISYKISVYSLGRSHPAHDFSVTTIQGKRDPNLFTVITPNFEAVRAPTDIALVDCDRTFMLSRIHRPTAMAIKQQVVVSHYAINPFGANAMNSVINALMAQYAPNAPVPVGAEIFNNCTDISKQHRVIRPGRRPSSVRPRGLSFCKSRDMTARHTKNRADNSYCSSPGSECGQLI